MKPNRHHHTLRGLHPGALHPTIHRAASAAAMVFLILWALGIPCPRLRAQVVYSQGVTTDTNGVLLTPGNFWTQNASNLAAAAITNGNTLAALNAAYATISAVNAGSNAWQTALTATNSALAGQIAQTSNGVVSINGRLSAGSGLSANIGVLTLFDELGRLVSAGPGSVVLAPNMTNYICLSLGDLYASNAPNVFHTFPRAFDSGCVFLGTIVTSGSGITAINQVQPTLPDDPFPALRTAVYSSQTPLNVNCIGTSLTAGGGTGTMWKDELFNTTYATDGYNIPNAAGAHVNVFAVGGTTAAYGLLPLFAASWTPNSGTLGWPAFGVTYGDSMADNALPSGGTPLGSSPAIAQLGNELWIYEETVNGGTYDQWNRELALKRMRSLWPTAPIIVVGSQGNSTALMNYQSQTEQNYRLSKALGCAFADWWSWVWEMNAVLGTNTFADSIHQNQVGWRLCARSLAGTFAPFFGHPHQAACTLARVLGGPSSSEDQKLYDAAEFEQAYTDSSGLTQSNSVASSFVVPGLYGANPRVLTVASNGYVTFANEAFVAMDLVLARGVGQTNFTATVSWMGSGGPTTIKTISWSDPNPPASETPNMLECLRISDVTPLLPNITAAGGLASQLYNGGIRITVTSGAASILGAEFYTVPKRRLAWHELGQRGTFADDVSDGNYPHLLYSDTDQNELVINYRGRGLLLGFKGSNAGGHLDVWQDGRLLFNQIETYVSGSGFNSKNVTVWPDVTVAGANLQSGFRDHECRIRLNGANASVQAASGAKHRLNLVYATIIGPQY